MSYILRDIECQDCGVLETLLERGEEIKCSNCNNPASIKTSFQGRVVGCDSFNPHYDIQLGQFFESSEHKARVLNQMGRVQESGTPSPRKTREDRKIMSKAQFHKGVSNKLLPRPRRSIKPKEES